VSYLGLSEKVLDSYRLFPKNGAVESKQFLLVAFIVSMVKRKGASYVYSPTGDALGVKDFGVYQYAIDSGFVSEKGRVQ